MTRPNRKSTSADSERARSSQPRNAKTKPDELQDALLQPTTVPTVLSLSKKLDGNADLVINEVIKPLKNLLQDAIAYLEVIANSNEPLPEATLQLVSDIGEWCNGILALYEHNPSTPQAAPTLELPTVAPELYEHRINRKETPIEFFERVWGAYRGIIYQDNLKGRHGMDPKLLMAIQNFCYYHNIAVSDIVPPKSHRINKALSDTNFSQLSTSYKLFAAHNTRNKRNSTR